MMVNVIGPLYIPSMPVLVILAETSPKRKLRNLNRVASSTAQSRWRTFPHRLSHGSWQKLGSQLRLQGARDCSRDRHTSKNNNSNTNNSNNTNTDNRKNDNTLRIGTAASVETPGMEIVLLPAL